MSKYSKTIAKKICKLIKSDSFTISEICLQVGIHKDTYYSWLKIHSDFSDAVGRAREERTQLFVAYAKKSLLKKIQGYTVTERRIAFVDSGETNENGMPKPKIKEIIKTTKHIQPDTSAIIFMLTNGEPENFKNKFLKEFTGIWGVVRISGAKDISKLQEP